KMILLSFFNSIFVNMFRPALWTLYHFFIFDNLTPLSKNHTLIQQRQFYVSGFGFYVEDINTKNIE
ncbi:hypothetical protein, partial [Geminocystis sp.]|uniref:hypothetical protein n=1 Tax=Geminocystis sp. TaxID=2664100 RepID=UPI003593E75F